MDGSPLTVGDSESSTSSSSSHSERPLEEKDGSEPEENTTSGVTNTAKDESPAAASAINNSALQQGDRASIDNAAEAHHQSSENQDGIGDFNLFNNASGDSFQLPVNNGPAAAAEEPYRTKVERKRSRHFEINDIVSSLEHILMVGNHNRHKQWRQQMWKKTEKPTSAERDSDSDDTREEKEDLKPIHFLHAEDVRIYGLKEGFQADPWPKEYRGTRGTQKRFKVTGDIDVPWNMEHGDSIHRLEFNDEVLSRAMPPPSAEEEEEEGKKKGPFTPSKEMEMLLDPVRVNQLDPSRAKFTIEAKDVPRALLLRCWQRAVNAASFTTLQSTQPPSKFHPLKDSTRLQQLQKPASQRCVDLTVDMYPWATPQNPPFKCRLCGNQWDTRAELKNHFHGTEKVRGCAWNEIHAKQRQLIADSLQKEVVSQADALVRFIVNKARDRLNAKDDKDEKSKSKGNQPFELPDLFSWKDILGILKEALSSSRESEEAEGGLPPLQPDSDNLREVTKTLQLQDDLPPLVLNHQVLEAVSSRLIDRYAHFPL